MAGHLSQLPRTGKRHCLCTNVLPAALLAAAINHDLKSAHMILLNVLERAPLFTNRWSMNVHPPTSHLEIR